MGWEQPQHEDVGRGLGEYSNSEDFRPSSGAVWEKMEDRGKELGFGRSRALVEIYSGGEVTRDLGGAPMVVFFRVEGACIDSWRMSVS